MEIETEGDVPSAPTSENHNLKADSTENFQKFIYELFEKNGILNDLRAYLRGHIVNILKSAQTGDQPACQKHFTQRLDLTLQALNVLIAEYLLCFEFSYTLSVFVSEIPLANMVFDFCKTLLQGNYDHSTRLKFKENDVWSILNYLGVKCDSEHASSIAGMYKKEEYCPLLLCMLKCMPMYNKSGSIYIEQERTSEESLSSSVKSSDTLEQEGKYSKSARKVTSQEKCKHYVFCRTCQNRMAKLRENYKKKKTKLAKNFKEPKFNPFHVENLMKNINIMERSLIEEMFQQLKTVYETEVEILKEEEQKKVRRSLASYSAELQKRQIELEEAFKAREAELERNVQQKKKFLWGLAQALRKQHQNMARAMSAVRQQTDALGNKEDNLKIKLAEAETQLKKRGEDMRIQISNELSILEIHLEAMKREKDSIDKERSELENLKEAANSYSNINTHSAETNELQNHYEFLKNELSVLKKYLKSTKSEPKCLIERSTITELSDVTSKINVLLNNEQDVDRILLKEEERGGKTPNRVVNDLKKRKNVNFSQSNLDEICQEHSRSRDRSRSSGSSEAGDAGTTIVRDDYDLDRHLDRETIQRLEEDNERLRSFARQQSKHIEELSSERAQLRAQVVCGERALRPRTAPPAASARTYNTHINSSISEALGWQKGAGEELCFSFGNSPPRVLVPGDTIPFIGVLGERPADVRRPALNTWRRRASPVTVLSRPRASSGAQDITGHQRPGSAGPSINTHSTFHIHEDESQPEEQNNDDISFQPISLSRNSIHERPKSVPKDVNKNREKSPHSVLREAKERLRNKESHHQYTDHLPPKPREKSPNSVLREAKLRLRKLEIEAEAVEKSYLNFRKRQEELKDERKNFLDEPSVSKPVIKNSDNKLYKSLYKSEDRYQPPVVHSEQAQDSITRDVNKYLKKYQTNFNIGEIRFKNRNVAGELVKPIPSAYSKVHKESNENIKQSDYLETPLSEFRKLYRTEKYFKPIKKLEKVEKEPSIQNSPHCSQTNNTDLFKNRNEALKKIKNDKKAELEILKINIDKMYNVQNAAEEKPEVNETDVDNVLTDAGTEETIKHVLPDTDVLEKEDSEKNILRIEVESVTETNDFKDTQNQDLLLVVKSSVDEKELVVSESGTSQKLSAQMTIIVSPKRTSPNVQGPKSEYEKDVSKASDKSKSSERSKSKSEKISRLSPTDALNAIFHSNKNVSSNELEIELSKEEIADNNSDKADDYRDDFSADVDNYNSRSDYENDNSPISLPKISDDENFWNS